VLSAIVATTLAVAFALQRILSVNPARDMLSTFINLLMLCSTFAVLRLVRGAPGDSSAKPQSTDMLLLLTLMVAGVIVGMWSGGHLFGNLSMLVVMSYAVGRWRGLKQSSVSPSDSFTWP
jgi:hypothetical protein